MENFNYRNILKNELTRRMAINSSYSLGAFARDLGISKSRLSEVLSERYGISPKSAEEIVPKLNLHEKEAEIFVLSVSSMHARSKKEKLNSQKKLKQIFNEDSSLVSLEEFKVISDWYHFAILELTEVDDFKSEHTWIAEKLNLKKKVVDEAVERLMGLGLLSINGEGDYIPASLTSSIPEEIPSHFVKEYHKQILSKAQEEIYIQSLEDRLYQAISISINKEDIPWIKEEIRNFQDQLLNKINRNGRKTDVYNFSVQLFNLTNTRSIR